MKIRRYDDSIAFAAHEGSIRAHAVFPKNDGGMKVPFESAWGYLASGGALAAHSHPTEEIYIVFKGRGRITVGEESAGIGCGDVVEIPANMRHELKNLTEGELLWLAFWWMPDDAKHE